MLVRPAASVSWLLPSHRDRRQRPHLSWWLYFQGMAFRSLKKTLLNQRRYTYISEWKRKDSHSEAFSVNALRNTGIGVYLPGLAGINRKFSWQHCALLGKHGSLGRQPWAARNYVTVRLRLLIWGKGLRFCGFTDQGWGLVEKGLRAAWLDCHQGENLCQW